MKLLLTGAYNYSENQIQGLQELGYKITFVQEERMKLNINVSNFEAVVCNSLFQYNDINEFKSLRFIQTTSTGVDRIPYDYIKKNEIQIYNAKGVYCIPIAEWTVLKILEIYKRSREFNIAQYNHKWEKQRNVLELTQKRVAIIGYGNIGKEIARRLKPFDVILKGVNRIKTNSELLDESYGIDDIDMVLQESDIVILALPLNKDTYHLINADKMNFMHDESVLINISRGSIIDERALIKAIQKNKFLGVALDVFEEEPLPLNSELWDLEKALITPHNSFISDRIGARLFDVIKNNLREFIMF